MSSHDSPRAAALLVVSLRRSHTAKNKTVAFYRWASAMRAERLIDQIERINDLLHGSGARPAPPTPEASLGALARTLAKVATHPACDLQAAVRAKSRRSYGRRISHHEEAENVAPICPDTPGEVNEKALARASARVRGLGAPMVRLFEKYADARKRLTRARAVKLFRDVDVVPALASAADVEAALEGDGFDDFCVAVARLALSSEGDIGRDSGAGDDDADPLRGIFRVIAASRRFYEASEQRNSPPKTPAHGLLRRWR